MCNINVTSIQKACNGGRGGLKKVLYIESAERVDAIPAAAAKVISTAITFKAADSPETGDPAGGFSQFAISKYDGTYTAEAQGDDENVSYIHTAAFRINRMNAAKNAILEAMNGGEVIAVVPDGNGNPWLFGDLEEPAIFMVTPESAAKNGYVCQITYRSEKLLDAYTTAITVVD